MHIVYDLDQNQIGYDAAFKLAREIQDSATDAVKAKINEVEEYVYVKYQNAWST